MSKPRKKTANDSAVSALRLKTIALASADFSQPVATHGKVDVQHLVKREIEVFRIPGSKKAEPESLQVNIGLGLRLTGTEGAEPPIYVQIEANFIARYEITAPVEDAALKAFAQFNAVHNVWPFWRQHVFDIVQRGHLDPIEVPLFSG